jgi:preprotein translocase subunit SecE
MASLGKFRQFTADTWGELKRTSWPSKQEVYGTTLVVVVAVLIVGAYLWLVDLVLAYLSQLFFAAAS